MPVHNVNDWSRQWFGAHDSASASYQVYTDIALAQALADWDNVVLFFGAVWCPLCIGLDNDINKHMENIPEDITILTLDYDVDVEMKEKYLITIQHTLLYLNSEGKEEKRTEKKYTTLDEVVEEVYS